jgi:Permuted papain-like amidase enzyme, YaeF/YiiX, C92 family
LERRPEDAGVARRYLGQPVKHCRLSTIADTRALATVLRQGDVLLTAGNIRMAALVRRLTPSAWSHVSIYVGPLEGGPDPRCIVEADVATGVRAVPLSEFEGQPVRILRPTRLQDAERGRVADWVVSRIGSEYDLAHAWALARRLLRLPFRSGLPSTPGAMAQETTRFICSSLLAQAFVLVGYSIAPTLGGIGATVGAQHRYVVPRDFDGASGFEVVKARDDWDNSKRFV